MCRNIRKGGFTIAKKRKRGYDDWLCAEATYIIKNHATVRQAAAYFDVSKSTIHKDMTKLLPSHYPHLAEQVFEVLRVNRIEGRIRGGAATQKRWKEVKEKLGITGKGAFKKLINL